MFISETERTFRAHERTLSAPTTQKIQPANLILKDNRLLSSGDRQSYSAKYRQASRISE